MKFLSPIFIGASIASLPQMSCLCGDFKEAPLEMPGLVMKGNVDIPTTTSPGRISFIKQTHVPYDALQRSYEEAW
uniref:Secreted protein n=1 Tax=Rhabditophanes sp. KR3021 TaxID=114890 RepID=A0AC35U183_9BILA